MISELSIGNDVTMRTSASDALAVIDQFEILRKLGGGGFGSVYLARDTVAGIEVAVKGLPPVVRNNTEELERIRANFALVSRLHHPYIAAALHLHRVQLADYRVNGVYEELNVGPGDTLMVMEYAPGVTLSQWRKQFPGGKAPLDVAVNLVYQVAMALDYSHAHQILHRDVKPSNIMVETQSDGSVVPRVLDFGLAAEIKSSMGRVSMEIHDTSGTRPYMAPEQWAGRKQGPATDQYALACLFCELVTGEVPFASVFETGDPMVMMTAVCNREVELPADCPRQHALKKALSKDPQDRYSTCVEFVENIAKSEARFDATQEVKSAAESNVSKPANRHQATSAPRRRGLTVALILAIVALGIGGFLSWQKTTADRARKDANRALESAKSATERVCSTLAAIEAEQRKRMADQAAAEKAAAKEAAEKGKQLIADTRMAELEAEKAKENRVAMEKKLELAKIEKEHEEEAKRQEQQRIEAAKKICKQCHGSGALWCKTVCKKCGGAHVAEITRQCKACKGDGERTTKIVCPACSGKGKARGNCASCGGKGTMTCSSCNGTGGSLQRTYLPGIQGRNRSLRKVKVNCDTCGGRGRVRCWCCNGGALVDCPRCDGTGSVSRDGSCSVCKGTGEISAKEPCPDCVDGYAYIQKECVSCKGAGKRLLVGNEKPDVFDGISLLMPMKVEYLPISFKEVYKTPRGYRAQFILGGTSNGKFSVSTGEEIGSTGWMFKSCEQSVIRKEVPGVSGMFRNVDVSTAVLVRSSDGKMVKLQTDTAPSRTQIDIKASLLVCGLDGSKNILTVTEGASFKLERIKFVVKEITMSSVTVEETSTGRKKVIWPEYAQSFDGKSDAHRGVAGEMFGRGNSNDNSKGPKFTNSEGFGAWN